MSKDVFDKIAEGLDEALDHVSPKPDVSSLLTKCCSKCGEWKVLDDFLRDKANACGRRGRCRVCYNADQNERTKRLRAENPEWRQRERDRRMAYYRDSPRAQLLAKLNNMRQYERNKNDPDFKARERKKDRIDKIKNAIARETCKRLGIDLTKLAKEQYDAEQRAKQTEQGLHQDQGSPAEDIRPAEGRPGDQAGRRRARSAGVVPGT